MKESRESVEVKSFPKITLRKIEVGGTMISDMTGRILLSDIKCAFVIMKSFYYIIKVECRIKW